MYGNASTQLLEFDATGKFVREIGKGVYGLGYAHGIRYDQYDNLWVVDKGTHTVMRFNPAGYVTLNLGRRPEGPDDPEWYYRVGRGGDSRRRTRTATSAARPTSPSTATTTSTSATATRTRGSRSSTRTATGSSRGDSAAPAARTPTRTPATSTRRTTSASTARTTSTWPIATTAASRCSIATATSCAIMFLNAAYDKKRQPVLGNVAANAPDETQPWTICITNTPTQYLYTSDSEPGRIYKLTLDGKILGMLGESGRGPKQFNWIHGIACPSENELLVADMNNWRVQKLTLHPERSVAFGCSSAVAGTRSRREVDGRR